jgi:hypothetical protein
MSQQPPHAMGDEHDVVRSDIGAFGIKQLLGRLQILAKLFSALQDRLSSRIEKEPWLIAFENSRVRAKIVLKILPGDRRRDQTVNEQIGILLGSYG